MKRMRVSVLVEESADLELYRLLENEPIRRRAALLRGFARDGVSFKLAAVGNMFRGVPLAVDSVDGGRLTQPKGSPSKGVQGTLESRQGMTEKELSISKAIADSFD